MKFQLNLQRLEQRENPSGTGEDPYGVPPTDPTDVPPITSPDPGSGSGTGGTPGVQPVDPVPPVIPY